ncbi:acyclic terpene utilization AtuA family protein [Hydrogenophaga sp. BPS33]|uniref:acyclic terpene utilization AtuA family protein n=1 Tax=Hydrogenophaga sp. BPS33 TaxID=2651974 RepID=UPI00131F9F11|nr:acyclic terpene utilization AtuA family protein [Hydrogenophaga sp. BPS33]QHE87515.1 DUF1446 domain-containing protein [Hydrogenophaga sp. BPS33]
MKPKQSVRIGGGSGFWGDSPAGPLQLVRHGDIDYLVLDYLAEITMSILARAKAQKPGLGYATDFVSTVVGPLASELARKGIKVIANAGGCNPSACCEALQKELARRGVKLRVAAVIGDDVSHLMEALRAEGSTREIWTGEPLPDDVLTANAYTGAFSIARALDEGADIVVTGRCADSALALGPLIHTFGWKPDDWDRLAAGSLAGHVIECGVQATGGYATDWKLVAKDWADMGFPIAVCEADGSFTITKPPGTGGMVNFGTVAEQVTYETGDPTAYILPDVVCDLSQVRVEEIGPDAVRVSQVRGKPATPTYKVSATVPDGFRSLATLFVRGMEASVKARAMGEAILVRTRRLMKEEGVEDYTHTSIEVLGSEEGYGAAATQREWREVVLKIAVRHTRKEALEYFSREIFPAATAMAQGIGGIFGGRPKIQPVMRLYSFLLDKRRVQQQVEFEGRVIPLEQPATIDVVSTATTDHCPSHVRGDEPTNASGGTQPVRLIDLAYARSGDKGDTSNIAVIARDPKYLPVLAAQLTAEAVASHLAHVVQGRVQRFDWPGLHGFNFLMEEALGGGGVASLRFDPQGKSHAQMLLEFPLHVPASWSVQRQ